MEFPKLNEKIAVIVLALLIINAPVLSAGVINPSSVFEMLNAFAQSTDTDTSSTSTGHKQHQLLVKIVMP